MIILLVVAGLNARAQNIEVFTVKNLHTVTTKVKDKSSGQPAAGRHLYLSVPGPVFDFRVATTDADGNAVFLVKNIERSKQVIIQANNVTDSNLVIETTTPIAKVFEGDGHAARVNEVGDTLPFYGKADKDYVLDEYVRFPTMEEVLREFVLEVKVKKSKDRFRIEVLNVPYNVFFDREPLVLLDGIPVFDTNVLMALDPLKIRNIQVVSRKYYFGSMVLPGIVSLNTYDGTLAGYQLPPAAVVREIR